MPPILAGRPRLAGGLPLALGTTKRGRLGTCSALVEQIASAETAAPAPICPAPPLPQHTRQHHPVMWLNRDDGRAWVAHAVVKAGRQAAACTGTAWGLLPVQAVGTKQ